MSEHVVEVGAYAQQKEATARAVNDASRMAQVAARRTREVATLRAALVELAKDFDSNVDWSAGRNNYGDNEAWESAARQVRELLITHPEREAGR